MPASAKDLMTVSNVMFLIVGVYFALIAGMGEGSQYTAIGSVLCFIAVGLSIVGDWFIAAPWRIATAAFCVLVLLAQVVANVYSPQGATTETVVSSLINGVLFLLMMGVVLSTSKVLVTSKEKELEEKEKAQEEELERKESKKKLTYEI